MNTEEMKFKGTEMPFDGKSVEGKDKNMEIGDDKKEETRDENENLEKREAIEKSKKAKKIIMKIDKLEKALKEEKNPIKRITAKFKLYQLKAELQQAIDLAISKAEFENRRNMLKSGKEDNDRLDIKEIAKLTAMKKLIENKLFANAEYDIQSPDFLYDSNIVEQQGGINNILLQLQNDRNPSSQDTVRRIQEMMEARAELNNVKKQLKETRERLNGSQKRYNQDSRTLNTEEMAMTVTSKLNIFNRIGNAFKAGKRMLEENAQMREKIRQLKEEEKRKDEMAKNIRDDTLEEARTAYERELEEIRKQRAELDAREQAAQQTFQGAQFKATREYGTHRLLHRLHRNSDIEQVKEEERKSSAAAYRQELRDMTGGVVPVVKSTDNQNEKNREEGMRATDDWQH